MFDRIKKTKSVQSVNNITKRQDFVKKIDKNLKDEFVKNNNIKLSNQKANEDIVNILFNHNFKLLVKDLISNGYCTNSLGAVSFYKKENKIAKVCVAIQNLETMETEQYEYLPIDFVKILKEVKAKNVEKAPEKSSFFEEEFLKIQRFLNCNQ